MNQYLKSIHSCLVLCFSIVGVTCNLSKDRFEAVNIELNALKQEKEHLLSIQKEQHTQFELEIINKSRLTEELNQCRMSSDGSKPQKNHRLLRQVCPRQACTCTDEARPGPWSISKHELSKEPKSHFQEIQSLFEIASEVGKNQQVIEELHRRLEGMIKIMEKAEKAKAKQQRFLTKEERELLQLAPSSDMYLSSQKKYEEAVQKFRDLSDQHTNSVKQYVDGKKAEENLWKKYVVSVQGLREAIQTLNEQLLPLSSKSR